MNGQARLRAAEDLGAGRTLSVAHAALYLDCGETLVRDLVASGELPAADIGIGRSKTRIRQRDLDAWLESRRTRAMGSTR